MTYYKTPANIRESLLWAHVRDLEGEGYGIVAARDGASYCIIMTDRVLPKTTALERFGVAIKEDAELKAAVLPFLLRHRPASPL